jgi:hypothetical protein|tara:strand:+ start:647 stop:847 length:201 start_codon:yes stop_codon:yes gene_type:complete
MNGIISFLRFATFSVGAVIVRRTFNWLTEDVDPVPGTKEFAQEYRLTKIKYERLKKKYESYYKSDK